MPSCIVCHLTIDNTSDSLFTCNNDHPVHRDCLAEWLLHSQNCPLCSDPYPQNIIDQFQDYKDQKEKEKQEALDKELEKEAMQKMEGAVQKVIFLKFIESIEVLVEEEKYDEAVDMLLGVYKENAIDENNLTILFHLGKANFLKGRYDLTINFLFKLVKIRFDYPDGFLYLGKAYEKLGLHDKAKWAFDRIDKGK
jgi:tetratricopeptide (TPR) repeat protein